MSFSDGHSTLILSRVGSRCPLTLWLRCERNGRAICNPVDLMVVRLGMHAAFSAFAEISAWNYRPADRVEFQLPVHAMRVARAEAITLRRVQATGGVGVGNPKGDQEALTRCRF